MKKLLIPFFALIFILGACATTSNAPNAGGVDLQGFIEKLRAINTASIETKRAAAIIVLEHVVFDIGFWEVMIETSTLKPNPNVIRAFTEIKALAKKRDELPQGEELSDYELSRTIGWTLFLFVNLGKHMSRDMAPQVAQLLALF